MKPLVSAVLASMLCASFGIGPAHAATTQALSSPPRWKNGPPADENYFPIAVWLQDPRNAARYKAAGINLYVGLWRGPTTNQLAQLQAAGMSVICAQNRLALEQKDNPIVVGWMHGDEPDNAQSLGQGKGYGPPILPEKIVRDYEAIRAADPSRPVLLNLGQGVAWDNYIGRGVRRRHPEDYSEYAKGSDIVSFDIYPAVHDNAEVAGKLEFVARGVERLVGWTGGNKTVWNCIECTHIGNPLLKATPQQVRAEVWMALIHGSRGLIYFVHQFKPAFKEAALLEDAEMLAGVTDINRQIRDLAPALNSPTIANGATVESSDNAVPIASMVKHHGDSTYLFTVNMRPQPARGSFALRNLPENADAEVLGESRTLSVRRGAFSDEFKSYGVHLYQVRASRKQAGTTSRMKLLSREVFLRHENKRPPATGFVTYVSKTEPVLMHCHGWEDYSDGYDDYSVSLSEDNGKTWSPEVIQWKSVVVPEGRIRYAEPAAFFDPDTGKLVVLTDKTLYPKDKLNTDADYALVMDVYDPKTRAWSERRELKFPGQRTPAMSFSFPLKTSGGRLVFPGMRKTLDASGKAVHYKKNWATVDEAVSVIGEYAPGGEIAWRLGQPLRIAPEISSRGLDESALTELSDGRLAAVCRGDNSAFPEKPGYKWLSFSRDAGESWSAPVPLPATGGEPIESGANGSALFRSIKNGRLYWMGNLALQGERANGNWPRSPLVIVEVQEEPFALKRDTIFTVDQRAAHEPPRTQHSNFRFYQDRETGDVVLFLTRYGERSEKEWKLADYYRYRVEMP